VIKKGNGKRPERFPEEKRFPEKNPNGSEKKRYLRHLGINYLLRSHCLGLSDLDELAGHVTASASGQVLHGFSVEVQIVQPGPLIPNFKLSLNYMQYNID
jgi:hypothetical protein